MPKKFILFFVSLFTLLGISSATSTAQAACYNVGGVVTSTAACIAGTALLGGGGKCEVCMDLTLTVCNPGSECPGGSVNSVLPKTGTDFICATATGAPQDTTNPWYTPALCPFNDKVFDENNPQEIFGERYTFAQVTWIMNSLIINIINSIFDSITYWINPNSNSASLPGSAIGPNLAVNLQPMSGIHEVTTTLEKFSIASPAFAQSYGAASIDGLRVLWVASRNSAYLIMVLLLVVTGFLIMFRVKVSSSAAVTLQVMIPKIIITLVLITFSFAIAGFMIDLAYVLINFVVSIAPANLVEDKAAARTFFTGPSIPGIFLYYFVNTLGFLKGMTSAGGASGAFIGAAGGNLAAALLAILFCIILFFLLAKVLWTLFKAYVGFIVQVIIAPWAIMIGVLPGAKGGFSSWFKSTASNMLVFVVVPLMFALNMLLWGNTADLSTLVTWMVERGLGVDAINNGLSTAPIGNLPVLPMLGGLTSFGPLFNALLGFVILSLIPKAADMIHKALGTSAFGYGSAIGEALGPASLMGSLGTGALNFLDRKKADPTIRPTGGSDAPPDYGPTGGGSASIPPTPGGGGSTSSAGSSIMASNLRQYSQPSPMPYEEPRVSTSRTTVPQLPGETKAKDDIIDGTWK